MLAAHAARRHVPVLAEQPDRARRAGADRARGARRSRPGWSWSTRRTGSSPTGRRSSWSTTTRRSSSRARSPRRGRWPGRGSATSSARRGWSPSSTRWCCRTTSTRPSRSPAGWRCASSTRWTSACAAVVAERERLAAALGGAAGRRVAERRELHPVPPAASRGRRAVWQGLLDRSVLVRDCSRWPRLDGLPARHDRHARGERRVPRRAARRCSRHEPHVRHASAPTKETVDRAGDRPRRHGRRRRLHRHPVLRPHARAARASHGGFDLTHRGHGRPAHRHPPHGRGRRRSRSARRSARRSATRPACAASPAGGSRSTRRWSRSRSTCPAARSWCGRCAMPEALPLGNPPFDPQLAEHAISSFATVGRHHAARHAACAAATCTTSSRRRSRAWPGACATRCASRASACRRRRACCDREPTSADRRARLRHRQPALGAEGAAALSAPTRA